MQAEVLSVGTELLLGQTVNTDTTIVAKALSALGIDLLYAAVVGDNVGRLEKAVYDALDRSDILITTGGLGPTGDDRRKRRWRRLRARSSFCTSRATSTCSITLQTAA